MANRATGPYKDNEKVNSLRSSIANELNEIKEDGRKRFGTKMPSKNSTGADALDATIEMPSYLQAIMSSTAALAWGERVKKYTEVNSLLNKENIYKLVSDIKTSIEGFDILHADEINAIREFTKNIDKLSNINVAVTPASQESIARLITEGLENIQAKEYGRIEVNFTSNVSTINEFINNLIELSKKNIDKDIFKGLNSLIEFFDSLKLLTDSKDIDKQLVALNNILEKEKGKEGELTKVFNNINDIASYITQQTDKDLSNINSTLQTIISILSIDPNTINVKGLHTLISITRDNGPVHKLFEQLDIITEDLNIQWKNLTALGDFFEGISKLGDIGLIKRIKIKSNLRYFVKYIVNEIPALLDELQKTKDKTVSKDTLESLGAIGGFFMSLVKISEIDRKQRRKLKNNLKYIKKYILGNISSLIYEIQWAIDEAKPDAYKTLEEINKIFENIFKVMDIPFKKLFFMELKLDYLSDIIKDELIDELIASIVKIDNLENVKQKLEDTNILFETLLNILDNVPSFKKLILAQQEISFIGLLFAQLTLTLKFIKIDNDQINSLGTKLNDINEKIFNVINNFNVSGDTVKKLGSAIAVITELVILAKFIKIVKIANVQITALENMADKIKNIINEFKNYKKETIDKAITAIKSFNQLVIMSTATLLIGALVMSKIKITDLIAFTVCLSGFLFALCSVFKIVSKSLKETLDGVEDAMKLVVATAGIMFFGSLIYSIIDKKALTEFTITLGVFLLGLSVVLFIMGKSLKDNLHIAKDITLLVVAAGTILILGSIAHNFYKFTDAMLFIVELGIFLLALTGVFIAIGNLVKRFGGLAEVKVSLELVAGATLILIVGSLAQKYYDFSSAMLFVGELAIFLIALGITFGIIGLLAKEGVKQGKKMLLLVVATSLIMITAQLIYEYLDFAAIMGFVGILAAFIIGLSLAYLIAGKLMKKAFVGIALVLLVTTLSGLILVLAGSIVANHPEILDGAIKFGGYLILYVALMGVVCGLLGLFSGEIVIGILCMAGIMLITLLAIGVMELMYLVASQEGFFDTILEGLKAMGVVFGSFCAVIAGLGALMLTGVGAAAFIAGVAALAVLEGVVAMTAGVIWLIAKTMKQLKSVNIKDNDFKNMKNVIVKFGSLIYTLADSIPLTTAFWKLTAGVKTVKQTSVAISCMAKAIKEFASLRIPTEFDTDGKATKWTTIGREDFEYAHKNIGELLKCIMNGILDVAKNKTYSELFEPGLFTDSKAMNAAKVAKMMGTAVGSIARGVKDIADLRFPTGYTRDGKPTGWITLGKDKFKKVKDNLESLLKCVNNALLDVAKTNSDLFDDSLFKDSKAMNAAKVAKMMGTAIGSIARGVKEIADLKIPTGYTQDGKPTGWITLSKTTFKDVNKNLYDLLTNVNDALLYVAQEKPDLFEPGLFTDSKAMNAAKVAKMMGTAIGSIARGVKEMGELKFATKFNEKGEPIKWISLAEDPAIFKKVGTNIENVLTCIGNALVNTIGDHPKLFKSKNKNDSPAMQAAKAISYMGMTLALTAKTIAAYSTGKIPVYDKDGNLLEESKWIKIDLDDIAKKEQGQTYKTIYNVLTCLGSTLVDIVKDPKNADIFKADSKTDSPALQAAKSINLMGTTLSKIIVTIKKLAELKTEDLTKKLNGIKTNVSNALTTILEIFNLFSGSENGGKNGVAKESVKGGFKGFINDTAKIFGGEGKVFETNGSIAEYINNHIKDIQEAGKGIGKFSSVITSLLNSLIKLGNVYKKNTEVLKLYEGQGNGETYTTPLITVFNNTIKTLKILTSALVDNKDIDFGQFVKTVKNINDAVSSYVSVLKEFVKLAEYSQKTGSDGYNTLKDGILSISGVTSKINSIENFKSHTKDIQDYVQAINDIDLSKINTLKGLIDSINTLSSNMKGIDKLTETLSKKLSVVLYELVNELTKADASIKNAHNLQEKRKKLIDSSIKEIKDLMNQHVIVEISQVQGNNGESSASAKVNNSSIDTSTPNAGSSSTSSNNTSSSNYEQEPNPENANIEDNKKAEKSSDNKALTFQEFTVWMENTYLRKIESKFRDSA